MMLSAAPRAPAPRSPRHRPARAGRPRRHRHGRPPSRRRDSLHERRQLGKVADAGRDEDRWPSWPTRRRCRGWRPRSGSPATAAAAAGRQPHILEGEVFAPVGEALLRQGALDDIQRLGEALAALAVGDAVGLVGVREARAADAEDQPALAELVDGRDFLGKAQRMAERQHLHGGADLHALGSLGDGGGEDQRRGQHRPLGGEVQLGQPHGVEPPAVRRRRPGRTSWRRTARRFRRAGPETRETCRIPWAASSEGAA